MTTNTESEPITGTKDKDYNIIWFTEACLSNALRLETYIQDAELDGDSELAEKANSCLPCSAPLRLSACARRKTSASARSPPRWSGASTGRGALLRWLASHPQRDSNPCCHLERVESWAAGRWGPRCGS